MELDNIEIENKIKKFRICNDSKEKMLFLNECIQRINKYQKMENINILITGMPASIINNYLDYLRKIFKYNGIDFDYDKINDSTSLSNIKRNVLLVNLDDESSWRLSELKYLKRLLNYVFFNKKIIIITSVNSIDNCEAFKTLDILNNLPCISFNEVIEKEKEYNRLIKKYKKEKINYNISESDFLKIINCVKDKDFFCNLKVSDYLFDYSTKKFSSSREDVVTIKTFDGLLGKNNTSSSLNFDKLIGLENVKKELKDLFNYARFLKKHNISNEDTYLNMFFLGNPGTGKTMVADLVAHNLYEMGYLEKDEVVKVIPTDLIGKYVGQTKSTIRKIFTNSKGKLLFIDEAYLLYSDGYKEGNNPFMQEAIIELLKYLEDSNNIVIFAGYKDKMHKIYSLNPGIKSRIYKEIEFSDYSIDELYQILRNDLEKKGFSLDDTNEKNIKKYIENMKCDISFGNARSMKQLSQKLLINHASKCSKEDDMVIKNYDIPISDKIEIKRMGFGD